uniref:SERPIN domain-containing protein n=1 Tax=Caenorhabditis tropicalis TaxID=1561998 RepID=A0A1I7TTN9_9PELO
MSNVAQEIRESGDSEKQMVPYLRLPHSILLALLMEELGVKGGFFADFIKPLLLKIKHESSGWPEPDMSDAEKKKYIDDILEHDGVRFVFKEDINTLINFFNDPKCKPSGMIEYGRCKVFISRTPKKVAAFDAQFSIGIITA